MSAQSRSLRLLALLLVLALAVGCGQYPDVHRDPLPVAEQTLVSDQQPAPPTPGPGAEDTGDAEKEVVVGEDGAQGPEGADVVGGSTSLKLPRKGGEGGKQEGGKGGGKPGGGKGDNDPRTSPGPTDGSGSEPPPTEVPVSPAPNDPITLAELISEQTTAGAEYNSTILPAGFPFQICPVQPPQGTVYAYSDDYGAPRYSGGYHPHAGNDIFAEMGAPIVAPFAGYVERVPNSLGGLAVKVHGDQGYVYMAHLVAYGVTERTVPAGKVVGFVGTTGNAIGTHPHNHFEWHPDVIRSFDEYIEGTNEAVNPFPYLRVVCPPD